MRLDFNVLWVDDQPGAVNAQIERIKTRMESEGFSFRPTLRKSLTEVETLIAEDVFQDEVDLILVDWDLGGGVQGQDVIAKVREVAPYLTRFAHPRVRARAPGGKAAAVTARAAVELEVALEVVSPTR